MNAPKTWVGLIMAAAIAGGCAASDETQPPQAPPIDDGEELPPEIDSASPADDDAAVDGTTGELGDEDDVLATNADADAIDPVQPVEAAGDQIVYVNFKGPTINNCGNYCSDALTNRSFVVGYFGKSTINFAPYTDAVRRGAILRRLRALYAKYRITFVTARPASGPYTMLVISPTVLPHHGIAPLDCGNADKSDIAFVYKIGGASADLIARFAAHELGHSFGLAHVVGGDQVMQWASSGARFGASNYDTGHPSGKCFNGTTQHAGAMLTATLGLR